MQIRNSRDQVKLEGGKELWSWKTFTGERSGYLANKKNWISNENLSGEHFFFWIFLKMFLCFLFLKGLRYLDGTWLRSMGTWKSTLNQLTANQVADSKQPRDPSWHSLAADSNSFRNIKLSGMTQICFFFHWSGILVNHKKTTLFCINHLFFLFKSCFF